MASAPLHAQQRQDEVFRAIQENMAKSTDPVPLLIFLAITATTIVIIALVVNRKTSPAVPKVVHSHAKLNRQMLKLSQISQAEWTDAAKRAAEVGAQSPLTVLLCDSLKTQTKSEDATL